MYFVYILECADDTLYTGWTTNIEKRLAKHNKGKGAKYTRYRIPVILKYIESYSTKKEAMQREYFIKQLSRQAKLELIESRKEVVKMKRALLVIDVQNEYFTGKLPITYPQGALENILKAIDTANKNNIPVVVIQHSAPQSDAATFRKNSHEWCLHPSVEAKERAHLVEKNLPGSFTGTDLEQWLRARDIDTVVIAGYMTQMCCDTTARQALHLGFAVEFLSDATGTLQVSNTAGKVTDEELHRAILVTQSMRFSKVLSTEEWIRCHIGLD